MLSSAREFVYHYIDLPWHVNRQIAKDFGVLVEDEKFGDSTEELHAWLIRIKEKGLLEELKTRVQLEWNELTSKGFR